MPFLNNIPQPGDKLKNSQGQLLGNNQQLDASFLVDHYTFSNLTADNGKHRQVTTPDQGTPPSTIANNPKLFGYKKAGTSIDTLQFSEYYDTGLALTSVPSPVTFLQSPSTPVQVSNALNPTVLDFTGITYAIASLWAIDTVDQLLSHVDILWNGSAFTFQNNGNSIRATNMGNILKLATLNAVVRNNVYWTLEFKRLV